MASMVLATKCTHNHSDWLCRLLLSNAVTNVGIGIGLFESGSGCSNLGGGGFRILWVYIAYIVFTLILQFVMFIIFAIVAANAELPGKLFKAALISLDGEQKWWLQTNF